MILCSRRRRTVAAGLVVGAAIIVVGFVPLLHGRAGAALPASTQTPATDETHERTTVHATIAAGRLLFVGASYSIGLGATRPAASYPSLLADSLDRRFSVDAVSGTGFQNPGRHHAGTFAQRILRISVTPPARIVIIQGGRDDTNYPLAKEYGAALETIRLAQGRFDAAQVVVLGPIPARLPVSAKVTAIRAAIGRACVAAHAGFIDPISLRWITTANVRGFAGRIHGHPNDAGYAYIATRLLAALPAALKEAQPPLLALRAPTAVASGPAVT